MIEELQQGDRFEKQHISLERSEVDITSHIEGGNIAIGRKELAQERITDGEREDEVYRK